MEINELMEILTKQIDKVNSKEEMLYIKEKLGILQNKINNK